MQEFARPAGSRAVNLLSAMLTAFFTTAVTFALNTTAHAQLQEAQVGVGVAVETSRDLYRGVGSSYSFWPLVSIESEGFRLFANEASLKLDERDLFDISLIGQYRLDGYDSGDSSFLSGMGNRRGALEFGIGLSSQQWFGELSLSALTDFSSRHKGHEVAVSYGYPLALSGARITPRVSLTWQSGDLVNYYWRVRDSEARAGRPEYVPGSSINLEVAVIYQRQLARHHRFFGKLALLRPGTAIENSPIRDADEPYSLAVGYLYQF